MLFAKKVFLHNKSSMGNHYSIILRHNDTFALNRSGINKYSFRVDVAFLLSQQFVKSHIHFLIFVEFEDSCPNKLFVATCDSSSRQNNHTKTHRSCTAIVSMLNSRISALILGPLNQNLLGPEFHNNMEF